MYTKFVRWMCLAGLACLVILAGCGPALTPEVAPTTAPTPDLQLTFDAIAARAMETLAAELTLNAPTAAPELPTNTPAPTNTAAPELPTNTPGPTETPTREFIPWTPTPTATQAAYACSITSVSPSASDTIKVDQDFDAKWVLKNTGTETWISSNTDIHFIEGTKFQTAGDLFDLTSSVAPNGTYTVTIDMQAPGNDGTYEATWGIYLEDGSVCELNLKINVSN